MDMRCSNNLWYVLMVVFCFLNVCLESNKSFACAYNDVFFIYELMLCIRKGYVLFKQFVEHVAGIFLVSCCLFVFKVQLDSP
jgi:hypothetical protein